MPTLQAYDVHKDTEGDGKSGLAPIEGTSVRLIDENGWHIFDISVSKIGGLRIRTCGMGEITITPEAPSLIRVWTRPAADCPKMLGE